MRLVIPLVLGIVGAGAGVGAGYMLKPAAETPPDGEVHSAPEDSHAAVAQDDDHSDAHGESSQSGTEFVKLNNQFIVPVLKNGHVVSMVVLSLTLETAAGHQEEVYALEPRIRDAFLQVMFDYANAGGFDGTFTSARALGHLREALKETGVRIMGKSLVDVLVTDIARQDT
ncbi:flagellar basal body-associated FliL family protein [Tropicimonas sediminicola]|uniref:Flagellar protein FliL n=1 Tax=Tropicimonas sediminicola TaxID=1031541 RepID=A0A239JCN2_9RHOB|nr:flagellar basal body-associated FliL family protein [Tropicimonas sediminicola]SNT03605.1 hypothetical protein SAMN05421757_105211 [Tropicimonas sediminicola]